MPIYPALALLIGSAMDSESTRYGLGSGCLRGFRRPLSCARVILVLVSRLPAPGDISQALSQHPELYTLSMGHMGDLTLNRSPI